MRTLAKDILTAAVMGLVVPGIVLSIAARKTEVSPETTPETTEQPTVHETVRLPVLVRQEDGTVSQMDMDSYLVGVVLAEMPVSFEDEALEAQSVVARTYARKAWETGASTETAPYAPAARAVRATSEMRTICRRAARRKGWKRYEPPWPQPPAGC